MVKKKKFTAWDGNVLYKVFIAPDEITVEEIHYPLPEYGNRYGDRWTVILETPRKRYAYVSYEKWNDGWERDRRGMTDFWIEQEGRMRKDEFLEFHEKIVQYAQDIEDDSPEVIVLARKIIDVVEEYLE